MLASLDTLATIQVVLAALVMSFATVALNRVLVDQKKLRALRSELKEYQKLLKKAMRAKDEKTRAKVERKLRKRMGRYQQLMKELSWEQMKSMMTTFLSFFIILFVLAPAFGTKIVAYFPIGPVGLNFIWWYVLSSMALGTLIQRALGMRWGEQEGP